MMSSAGNIQGDIVVLAADGSEEASNALQFYKEHFHKEGNTVVIAHALDLPAMPTRHSWDANMQKEDKKRTEMQESYAKKLTDLGLKGKFVSDHEKPGPFICMTAKNENATYIVMGTRGLGKLKRTVLGSVSDYVIHHSECPVFVYRAK